MTPETAVAWVQSVQSALNAQDLPRLVSFYAEDAVIISPMFRTLRGSAEIANSWKILYSMFPDWKTQISDVLVDGDRVAGLGMITATDRRGWFGLPAIGVPISYRATIVWTVAEGRIVREEQLYDLTAVIEHVEKAQLDRDLRTAAEVQAALLSRATRAGHYYEAVGNSVACRAISGDFFEFIELPSGEFGVALDDVSGKGTAAAVLAAMLQGMFAVEAQTGNHPAVTLARINRALVRRGLESRFVTLVYGVLSPNGRLIYSNAGHNPPVILARNGIRRLTIGGPILGTFQDARFEEEELSLDEQDTLVMFTDGVTEATNVNREEFGEDRLMSCLNAYRASPVRDMLNGLFRSVSEFCKETPQRDDITATVTRFR